MSNHPSIASPKAQLLLASSEHFKPNSLGFQAYPLDMEPPVFTVTHQKARLSMAKPSVSQQAEPH